ncbi:MAG: lipid-A-disaccharide synthase [Candidatus Omnitrophica bacterium]|nr:lipid-A-disaccharide synthase [Candidatus Omnitrophota bacterium]MDD5610218.1 lipid-A-disaccharide synthase [Candidatus Omnitrophota bacterium]
MEKQILIIAGEPSGDLNAGNLTAAIKNIDPTIRISGLGGEYMRRAGAETYFDIKDFAVMGLFDVLKKLPKFIALKNFFLKKIKEENFSAVIFVDFSGFNLRLAKALDKKIPTIYYVSPQVWASRPGRCETIRKYISKMIVIFKFEKEFYKKHGIAVDFVGHPLLDIAKPTLAKEEFMKRYGLAADKINILLMPGSRKSEVLNILPIMLEACRLIKKETAAQFVIAKPTNLEQALYAEILKNSGIDFKIIEGLTYDCLNIAHFCLVASGTATLETAIMQKPFVVIYKMGALNYLLYRPQVKVPYIGMVNIVAGKKIIPEFIQNNAQPKPIADYLLHTLHNPAMLSEINKNLSAVKASLGEPGASKRAAKIILDFIG